MEDPILNRNLEEIKELQTRWNQFHDFFNMAAQQGLAKITPQAELKFLELKSRIAMLHDGFMGGVKGDVKTAQNILQIVADCIMLKKVAQASEAEKQKFEFDWNECFMLLNETISTMEEEKKRLAGVNERAYKAAQRRDLMKAQIHNFLHSPLLKWAGITFGIIFVLFGLPFFNIYHWDQLYINPPFGMTFTKTIYKNIAGYAWRPFIQPDMEFCDYEEAPIKIDKVPDIFEELNSPTVNPNNVATRFFPTACLSSDVIEEARKLFNDRKDKPMYIKQGNLGKCTIVGFLLNSTADAKRFVDLQKQSFAKLPAAQQEKTKNEVYVRRNANLVCIATGNHPIREGWVIDHWGFDPKGSNELSK